MGCSCVKPCVKGKSGRRFTKVGQDPGDVSFHGKLPELTAGQKALIRNNWQVLKLHIANVGVITFVSMFESRPELLEVFADFKDKDMDELKQNSLLRRHALRVMATVDKCISRMEEPEKMQSLLETLGKNHRAYKVPKDFMSCISTPFIHAIKPHILHVWSDDVELTWRTFLAIIIYHIRQGMKKGAANGSSTPDRSSIKTMKSEKSSGGRSETPATSVSVRTMRSELQSAPLVTPEKTNVIHVMPQTHDHGDVTSSTPDQYIVRNGTSHTCSSVT